MITEVTTLVAEADFPALAFYLTVGGVLLFVLGAVYCVARLMCLLAALGDYLREWD